MNDRVTVDIQGGVADVRLVRADKMNALDNAMFAALIETGERLKGETGVRAVVLSGEGRAFCAGLDMGNFAAMASGDRSAAAARRGALVTPKRTAGGVEPGPARGDGLARDPRAGDRGGARRGLRRRLPARARRRHALRRRRRASCRCWRSSGAWSPTWPAWC